MPTTPNLLIDHIIQSQSQKEVTANTSANRLEQAITEHAAIAIAGTGSYTATDAEMRNAIISFTGILTGNRDLIVPNRDKIYIVQNATTGAFTLQVKTSAGVGVIIEQGFMAIVYCDGVNVLELSGPIQSPYRTGIGTFTVRITDQIIFCDATAGNVLATLPAASVSRGRTFQFIRVDTSANTVTIQRAGADDINNAVTSRTITNVIGTALIVTGFSATRFHAQTVAAA